jgi:hypothetical protein
MIRKLSLGLLLIALLLSVAAQDDKSYSADRFDVDVAAQYDRSLLVEETVTFRFVGGPFSFVFRELPLEHTDGITDIVAGMDGEAWPQGTGPGQVEITGRDPIVVTWHLPPTSDAVQTFTLSYRALGVVTRVVTNNNEADVLAWQALPDEYEYEIASNRVVVDFPAGAQLLGQPEVTAGKAEATVEGNQAVFTQGHLSAGDPLVVQLNFAPGSFSETLPARQIQAAEQNSRAWIWIVVAAATLVGGILLVVFAARPFRRASTARADQLLSKPPNELPPALAGYLTGDTISGVGWPHALGTLFDLAGRGLITIEETAEKKWYSNAEFSITYHPQAADLRRHEQELLDLLFTDKKGASQTTLTSTEMGRRVTSSRWKKYTDSVMDEIRQGGFLDKAAEDRRKQLIAWGIALMLLTIPLFITVFLVNSLFGYWPLLFVAAVFIIGLVVTIVGASISTQSAWGAQQANAWQPFKRFLREVSRDKAELSDPAYYDAYLPYATAFGYAGGWMKRYADSGYDRVPTYFSALSADGSSMAAFVAIIAATSSSGGAASASAAGAAGAGAAGGGASGAG